eukprot:3122495-Rhodomonas_salina.1
MQEGPETPPTATKKRKTPDAGYQAAKVTKSKPTSLASARGKAKASAEEAAKLKPAEAKKELNAFVRSLASSVRHNWHDGYEQQAEEHQE